MLKAEKADNPPPEKKYASAAPQKEKHNSRSPLKEKIAQPHHEKALQHRPKKIAAARHEK